MPQRSRQHTPVHAPVGELGRAAAAQAASAYAGGGRAGLGRRFPLQRGEARRGQGGCCQVALGSHGQEP